MKNLLQIKKKRCYACTNVNCITNFHSFYAILTGGSRKYICIYLILIFYMLLRFKLPLNRLVTIIQKCLILFQVRYFLKYKSKWLQNYVYDSRAGSTNKTFQRQYICFLRWLKVTFQLHVTLQLTKNTMHKIRG